MQVSAAFDGAEKESVLYSQSLPLVKFFHCVSFLNQTLLQSPAAYSPFHLHYLIHILSPFSLAVFAAFLFYVKSCHSLLYPRSYHLQILFLFKESLLQ